ncbi:MAG TPA: endolytic transglycosylase MltG [Thermoanaerobacterales bacterium]|nr:endolytic transglycosylase MltG [Thermoanaerobacterales bacterium]
MKHLYHRINEGRLFQLIKKTRSKIFFIIFGFLMVISTIIWFYAMLNPKDIADSSYIEFQVDRGISANQLAVQMSTKNLIKNPFVFSLYAKLKGLDIKIKSGNYLLSPSMTVEQILEKLVLGDTLNDDTRITIPEGTTLEKIASIFEEKGLVSKSDFLKTANVNNFKHKYPFLEDFPTDATLEGFLFPDTYFLPTDKNPEFYIDILLEKFEETYFNKVQEVQLKNNIEYTPFQIVTIASIIEAEAQLDSERPIIAGVIYNRLRIGKPLELCATVAYVLDEHKEVLTFDDLEVESPYNTYKNVGLPPGPIGAPGLSSLMAAVNPADVEYLYFVAKGDGSHIFSKTFSEHIKAQNEIQKMKK